MSVELKLPLNLPVYEAADTAFVRAQTKIDDDEELKKHILDVRARANSAYFCVQNFGFTRPKISMLPGYSKVLDLVREHPDTILLELGCCFGADVRKIVSDGFPAENIVASDLNAEFWPLGHDLFKTSPSTLPVKFLAGDAFDASFLQPFPPLKDLEEIDTAVPTLAELTTLTPLRGHVSAIHLSLVFHLFSEPQQEKLARALAGLLSPRPGSIIFGHHGASSKKGISEANTSAGRPMFCHSAESWVELWTSIFPESTVVVDAVFKGEDGGPSDFGMLVWSVTRVR